MLAIQQQAASAVDISWENPRRTNNSRTDEAERQISIC
ncbi:hypothetical protein ABIB17_001933 [Arthrobacter sp. UYEF6]